MRLRAGMTIIGMLAVVGCGDEPAEQVTTEREPLEAVLAATTQSSDAESFRMSMRYELGESNSACADEMMPSSMAFEAAIDGSGEARVMEVTDQATGEVGIVTGDALYIQASVLSEGDVNTPWVAIGVDDYEGMDLLGPSALVMFAPYSDDAEDGMGSLDSMFEEIRETAGTVTEVGTEEIRGEPATHYRVEIDPDKVRAQYAAEYGMDPTSDDMDGFPMLDHIDVWIGEDGYVRRVETLPADPETDPLGFANVHVVAEAWDHGADITIAAPPAEDVTRASDLDIDPIEPESLSPECEAEMGQDLESNPLAIGGIEGWTGGPLDPARRACFEAAGIEVTDDPPEEGAASDVHGGEGPWYETPAREDPRWGGYVACLPAEEAAMAECLAGLEPPLPTGTQPDDFPDADALDRVMEGVSDCLALALPDECLSTLNDTTATTDPTPTPDECFGAFGGSDE